MVNLVAAILLMVFFIAVGCDRSRHSVNGLVLDEQATTQPLDDGRKKSDVERTAKPPIPIISSMLVVRP